MRKLLSVLFASLILFASACTERTCPTYSKAPVDSQEINTDTENI